jgi:hypothetical protein
VPPVGFSLIAAIGVAPGYTFAKTVAVVTGDEKMSREIDDEYREIRERIGEFGAEHSKDAATAIVTVAGTVASALAVGDHLRKQTATSKVACEL